MFPALFIGLEGRVKDGVTYSVMQYTAHEVSILCFEVPCVYVP